MSKIIQPPTACLPSVATIATSTSEQLFDALQYLHSLYLPHVRGSRRRRRCHDDDDNGGGGDQVVQSDAFERAYAIRWLTALIARLEVRQDQPLLIGGLPSRLDATDHDRLIQQAASLLAICAGVAAAGRVHRQFTFKLQIHIALTDIPLDNHDYASVGAQTWGGACVLADMIAEHPDRFGLGSESLRRLHDAPPPLGRGVQQRRSLRVLELGAGTGLVGLTAAKLLESLPPHPTLHHQATVILTDFYPAVLDNLQSNIDANFPTISDGVLVHSCPLDWSSFSPTATDLKPDECLSIPFDVVFGADIVYEVHHAVWIRDCLKSLLAYPDSSNVEPTFHLVIPLRPTHTFESGTVEEVFGFKEDRASRPELAILSKESIVCEAYGYGLSGGSREDEDVEYVYYRIGWTK